MNQAGNDRKTVESASSACCVLEKTIFIFHNES